MGPHVYLMFLHMFCATPRGREDVGKEVSGYYERVTAGWWQQLSKKIDVNLFLLFLFLPTNY